MSCHLWRVIRFTNQSHCCYILTSFTSHIANNITDSHKKIKHRTIDKNKRSSHVRPRGSKSVRKAPTLQFHVYLSVLLLCIIMTYIFTLKKLNKFCVKSKKFKVERPRANTTFQYTCTCIIYLIIINSLEFYNFTKESYTNKSFTSVDLMTLV